MLSVYVDGQLFNMNDVYNNITMSESAIDNIFKSLNAVGIDVASYKAPSEYMDSLDELKKVEF